jgi:hypothetical protein
MLCDLRHGLRHVPETARAFWIANLARAATRLDVSTHALDGGRTASSLDLGSHVGFILTEAIADDASARRLFLPYGDAKIDRCERVVRAIEVDHLARGDRTKTILSRLEALKGDVGEQRLHREEIDGRTLCLT